MSDEREWQSSTLKIWKERSALAALAHLEAEGAPAVVAERYGALLRRLYNDKDVPKMIVAARAGIAFALREAGLLEATDAKAAVQLKGQAKAMAYNLGANCWPGWDEPGIDIRPIEMEIGLDAARTNLRLGRELRRSAEPLGHAHWLLGAQLLAAKQFDAAAAEFVQSAQQFVEANKPIEEQMALAYEKLTRRLQHAEDAEALQSLQSALTALEKFDHDDARFFAAQIRTAEKVFAK